MGESGNRDGDVVSHAARFDDGLVGMLLEQHAAQVSDHTAYCMVRRAPPYNGLLARRRFFVDAVRDGRAELRGDAARHLTRVLRAEAGQRYEISDGRAAYLAEIVEARGRSVVFRVIEPLAMPPNRCSASPCARR